MSLKKLIELYNEWAALTELSNNTEESDFCLFCVFVFRKLHIHPNDFLYWYNKL